MIIVIMLIADDCHDPDSPVLSSDSVACCDATHQTSVVELIRQTCVGPCSYFQSKEHNW